MHFMRENLLDRTDVTIAPVDAVGVSDGLYDRGYAVLGSGTVTFTFAEAVTFDRIFVKTSGGITRWTSSIGASASELSGISSEFQTVSATGVTTVSFTFTGGGIVLEIMLMPLVFDLDVSQRPMRFEVMEMDPSGTSYRTEDDTLVSYAGQSEGKAMILVGWDYMPKPFTEQIRGLWKGPPIRRPFIIYPEPDDNPDDIYKVYYKNDFKRTPSAKTLVSGYTVNMVLEEI